MIERGNVLILVLQELAPQRLHFFDVRDNAGISILRIRYKLPVMILYTHGNIG